MPKIHSEIAPVIFSDAPPMHLHIFEPETAGKLPVVLVLQEAFGITAHIRDICERLASQGCVAVAPEFFHRTAPAGFQGDPSNFNSVLPHTKEITVDTIKADIFATMDWIRGQARLDSSKISAVGFCMGGRAVYMTNSWFPLKAAVSFYGSRIVPDFLPMARDQKSPLMLIWGGMDHNIPATQRRALNETLTAEKKDFIDVEFATADHGFLRTGSSQFHSTAATEAWLMTINFLKNRGAF